MRLSVLAGSDDVTVEQVHYTDGTQGDAGAITVTVTDANGVTVATGAATQTGTGATTVEKFTIPSNVFDDPGRLEVRWVRDDGDGRITPDTVIDVNAGLLFTLAQARSARILGDQAPLTSTTTYPNARIAEARVGIGDLFEDKTGRSWFGRYCRVELGGYPTHHLPLWQGTPRTSSGARVGGRGWAQDVTRIISVTSDAVDVADVVFENGYLFRFDGTPWPARTADNRWPTVVEYVYGVDPTPSHVTDYALSMLLKGVVPSNISAYAQSMSTDQGTFSFDPPYPRDVWQWFKDNVAVSGVA